MKTDPALWTTRPVFGVAGGPLEVVLTAEGLSRAFSVGAKVRRGGPAEALEALWLAHGEGPLTIRNGCRHQLTDLGRHDQVTWGHLRVLGYVESVHADGIDGIRFTERGRAAAQEGVWERERLLARCRREALLTSDSPVTEAH